MAKKPRPAPTQRHIESKPRDRSFHLEFKNATQKQAWSEFQNNDILFLMGPAGTGKSFLGVAFAINEILAKRKDKIILTRPIVEAGENLGFLPGTFDEKVAPYMMPLTDSINKLVGKNSALKDLISQSIEVRPLAYMRGTAQPIHAKIITPDGVCRMGDIKVGDDVIGSDGQPIKVLGVFPQGFKDVYCVTFSDGSKVECCGEHLWSTQTLSEKRHDKGFSIKDTLRIKDTLKTRHNQKNHKLPILSAPVRFEEQAVSVDPYLLGLLLGDGRFHESDGILLANSDPELIELARESLIETELKVQHKSDYDYVIVKKSGVRISENPLKTAIRNMGLMGKKSYDKYIPDCYLYNSVETRIAILQGLMDSDGSCGAHRSGSQYYSISEKMADNVIFLVQSLGGVAHKVEKFCDGAASKSVIKGKAIRHCRNSFTVDIALPAGINPFRLSSKKDKYTVPPDAIRLIASIEQVNRSFCQCILVDSPDHLYLTEGCVLTHNTFDNCICLLDEAQNATRAQLKMFVTRLGENSKMIINGDPDQSDLPGAVALDDMVDRLEGVEGIGMIQFNDEEIVRHPLISRILKRI